MRFGGKKIKWGILLIVFLLGGILVISPPWSLLARMLLVNDAPQTSDVLITLGGDSERELYAAELYKAGLASKIIMSGCGNAASQMALRAIQTGVKETDIMIESNSKSTYDNAVFTKEIVLQHQFKSAIVISSPYHMRRSKLVFDRVFKNSGVKLIYCSVKNSDFNRDGRCENKNDRRVVQKEYIKLVYYWFRYWK